VNVNVTLPEVIAVINPALVMVAMAGLLLIHVPPATGLAVMVAPAHNDNADVVTTGRAFTVTLVVILLHPVAASVKVNVAEPADTPVINPALSIVATAGLLLTQAPPVTGLAVIVAPAHNVVAGVLTTGKAFTVTLVVVLLHPVAVSVKVNVTLPAVNAVINPALVMVAIAGLLLTHVPPVTGVAVMVAPAHKDGAVVLTTGSVFTVTLEVVLMQPVVVLVKVNVTVPAVSPVINPALSIVATAGLLLTHVPPVEGLAVMVAPAHIVAEGVLTTGRAFTLTLDVVLLQPVAV